MDNDELSISGVIRHAEAPMGGGHRSPGSNGCLPDIVARLAVLVGSVLLWLSSVGLGVIFVYHVVLPMTFMKPILELLES